MGLGALIIFIYYKLSKNQNFWRDRGVPDTGFKFLWGDDKEVLLGKKSIHEINIELYKKFPEERFYGGWSLLGQPYLMLRNDFDLIRAVWIKDFDHFTITRNTEFAENVWPATRTERIALNHIAALHGDIWKDLR